jgi:hypothetical protein
LAVALVAVPALAQTLQLPQNAAGIKIQFAPPGVSIEALNWTRQGNAVAQPQITIPPICQVPLTSIDILVVVSGQQTALRISCNGQVAPLLNPPQNITDIQIKLATVATIQQANWRDSNGQVLSAVAELQGKQARFIDLDFTTSPRKVTVTVPTLTEWGLIALAVLLAGGMGYILYRRRPALRPAAP